MDWNITIVYTCPVTMATRGTPWPPYGKTTMACHLAPKIRTMMEGLFPFLDKNGMWVAHSVLLQSGPVWKWPNNTMNFLASLLGWMFEFHCCVFVTHESTWMWLCALWLALLYITPEAAEADQMGTYLLLVERWTGMILTTSSFCVPRVEGRYVCTSTVYLYLKGAYMFYRTVCTILLLLLPRVTRC